MNSRLQILFEKYFEKSASPEERDELSTLLQDESNREEAMQLFTTAWSTYAGDEMIIPDERREQMLEQIIGKIETPVKNPSNVLRMQWWRYAAAAAILVFVIGGYWLINNKKTTEPPVAKNTVNDVNPGSYKARLTLADGSTITLDSAALGELAKQGNTLVINKDGQLVYNSATTEGEVLYNTVSTAKGETYTMTLADGSKVWLNSGSSIHFPVAFPGKERRIEVTGEVYVKVAKNPAQPFISSVHGMEVLALGTEFNMNA